MGSSYPGARSLPGDLLAEAGEEFTGGIASLETEGRGSYDTNAATGHNRLE
jgi:hypothetical protein